jgi:hypothetical protein
MRLPEKSSDLEVSVRRAVKSEGKQADQICPANVPNIGCSLLVARTVDHRETHDDECPENRKGREQVYGRFRNAT